MMMGEAWYTTKNNFQSKALPKGYAFSLVGLEGCCFFDKLLLMDLTINSDKHCGQLAKLNAVIHQKCPALVNH